MEDIDTAEIQVINGKTIICLEQEDIHDYIPVYRFIVVNKEGKIEAESEDLGIWT